MKGNGSIDMTHGPLLGKILWFSLPLMASNILQLLFNAADVVVVGRFAGYTNLAAVSSTVPLINLFITLLMGLSVGVNVVIARYLGLTGHAHEIARTLHTAVLLALAGGTVLAGISAASAGWMLDRVAIPQDVRPLALVYMRIYLIGTPFSMLYNYGAAALRAAGDTRRPLLYLLVSGVTNVALNLAAVIGLQLGVVGVAAATVISQTVSALLILNCLRRTEGELHFSWRQLCLDKRRLIEMAHIGVPAGVQACLFSLSNVVIQGAINAYGSVIMAGCGAAESIENFLYVSMNSFHQACQTFVSQNVGAGKQERIGRILRTCVACTLVLGVAQSALAVALSHPLVGIYNSDPAVVQAGAVRLACVASLYVIFGVSDVFVGGLRGLGAAIAPVIINLLGTCAFRLIWVAVLDTSRVGVEWVYLSYPISWTLILLALAPFWAVLRRRQRLRRQASR